MEWARIFMRLWSESTGGEGHAQTTVNFSLDSL
jgi:hypothetical protein